MSSVSRLVTADGSSSPVAGSNSAHLTVTPALSAAITHGRTLASWSSLLTTISSPGSQSLAIAREMSKVSWVMLRPNTTPSGTPPSRSATAARAASTTSSALRSAGVSRPRLESGWVIACRMASPTTSGVCVPPGPSKYAVPPARLGKCARSAWTSYMLRILPGTPSTMGSVTLDEAVLALRAAGCVHAEDEAALIWDSYADPSARASAVADRASGRPLEQVVGWAEFGPVRVALGLGVFVPRRRAEAILEPAVALKPDARIVVDLGCGAGALAASLAVLLPDAEVHGVDVDEAALECARRTGGFQVHQGSWWSGLPAELAGHVDLAVAYLPHVPTSQLPEIHADFRSNEPSVSVDGGPDGLDPLRAVLADADHWLAPDGAFVTLLARKQVAETGLEVMLTHEDDAVVVHRPDGRDA